MLNKHNLSLIAIFFCIFSVSVAAQAKYSVPKKIDLEKIVEKTFPKYYGHEFPHLIPETFFPIGWSRDGKFAYYVEPVDEACGCYFAKLVIQDLRTDKIIWEFKYQGEEVNDENTLVENLETLWAKNKNLFSEKLRANKIEQKITTTVAGSLWWGQIADWSSRKNVSGSHVVATPWLLVRTGAVA